MLLDDLIARLENLTISEVFHQPYDLDKKFQNDALNFIKKYFEMRVKTNDEQECRLYEDYLTKAFQVLLTFKILDGNFTNLVDVLAYLKELEKLDESIFSTVTQNVLKDGGLISKKIEELVSFYNDRNFYPVMRNYSIHDYFNISKTILFAPTKYNFGNCTSITTDSKYLYIILTGINGGMLKVGTGNNGTIRGKVYLFKKNTIIEETSQLIYVKNKLYLKIINSKESGYLIIINPETFNIEGRIKLLLPENTKNPIIKKKNENYVLLNDDQNIYVLILEPVFRDSKSEIMPEEGLIDTNEKPKDKKDAYSVPVDIFSYINLMCYTFPIDNHREDINEDNDKTNIVIELYEAFSHLFTRDECRKALILNKWNIEVLINNLEISSISCRK
jgi:hypothetical protein